VRALTGKRSNQGVGRSSATHLPLFLAVLLALAACSGDSNATDTAATSTTGQAATTASTSTATTATTEDSGAAVLAAYRAFWADVVAAGKTADWQSPRLARHATGKVLARVRGQFRALDSQGFVALGTIKVSPRVVRLAGEKARSRTASTPAGSGATTPRTSGGSTSSAASLMASDRP
jgi:hypothetical protein